MSHKVRSVYRVLDFSSLGKDCNFLLLSVLRYMKIFHESSAECVLKGRILDNIAPEGKCKSLITDKLTPPPKASGK
jgi:hypothetical protein